MDNFALEKLYCDVNVEAPVNFKPAQSLEVSSLQRQVNEMINSTVFFFIDEVAAQDVSSNNYSSW